jgi:hypothetical protein
MRIEWVKLRLENWALWKERERSGGLGFSSTTSFLHEVDTSRYREARIPVDEVDASVTDEAVEELKPGREHLYRTLYALYVAGSGVRETARQFGVTETAIRNRLEQCDKTLAAWFHDRKERQMKARKAQEAVLEAARAAKTSAVTAPRLLGTLSLRRNSD